MSPDAHAHPTGAAAEAPPDTTAELRALLHDALTDYASHAAWRCEHPDRYPHDPECPCGYTTWAARTRAALALEHEAPSTDPDPIAYELGDRVQLVRNAGLNAGRIGVVADTDMRAQGFAFDLRIADRLGPETTWSSWANPEDLHPAPEDHDSDRL